ncbi:MAG TPA: shikimate kinase [Bacteroidales bacterium]|nr:shikimate kinase [Bacteroidales bacterium]
MKVFLIGFMGSGKSTTAKKLASRLGYECLDLDALIEQGEGRSINELFRLEGEDNFRKLEYRYLRSIGEKQQAVIATGGGTPCYHGNMDYMNATGITVYLKMAPTQLHSRLKNTAGNRPLLKGQAGGDLVQSIVQKLEEREGFYRQATLVADGFSLDVPALADEIVRRLKK